MRSFIAIEIDEAIHRQLARAQDRLRRAQCPIKWVEARQMHLTLKFLGEIEPEMVDKVAAAMAAASAGAGPFELRVAGVGAFPPQGAPRVVWAGVEEPRGALAALHERLEGGLEALGFEREGRPLHPHLTLGRAKGRDGARRLAELMAAEATTDFGSQIARELVLFRSELSPKGPTYTALARHGL